MNESWGSQKLLPTHSLALMESLKGRTIVKLFKSLEWEKEKMLETFKFEDSRLFELAYAKLYMELDDGRIICFFNNDKRISVSISLVDKEELVELVQGKEIIHCSDKRYSRKQWADIVWQSIVSFNIIKLIDDEYGNNMGMNERGIQFKLDSSEFLFTQALANKGPGSTVLMTWPDIADIYTDKLEVIQA